MVGGRIRHPGFGEGKPAVVVHVHGEDLTRSIQSAQVGSAHGAGTFRIIMLANSAAPIMAAVGGQNATIWSDFFVGRLVYSSPRGGTPSSLTSHPANPAAAWYALSRNPSSDARGSVSLRKSS